VYYAAIHSGAGSGYPFLQVLAYVRVLVGSHMDIWCFGKARSSDCWTRVFFGYQGDYLEFGVGAQHKRAVGAMHPSFWDWIWDFDDHCHERIFLV
jgi:hypothetical protein